MVKSRKRDVFCPSVDAEDIPDNGRVGDCGGPREYILSVYRRLCEPPQLTNDY